MKVPDSTNPANTNYTPLRVGDGRVQNLQSSTDTLIIYRHVSSCYSRQRKTEEVGLTNETNVPV